MLASEMEQEQMVEKLLLTSPVRSARGLPLETEALLHVLLLHYKPSNFEACFVPY